MTAAQQAAVRPRSLTPLLMAVLAACILRFWIVPLPSSFWLDEMVTSFVIHYGAQHASLRVAPQVTETIYYAIPELAEKLFGFSEVSYRIPSLALMGVALIFIACLAARLIHPQAAWFAVFACLSLKGFNYQAADARPYGLGTAVTCAALWLEIRWLDRGRWIEGIAFAALAAALWRVHLIYWPFYAIFAGYAIWRIAARETPVTWLKGIAILTLLGAALVPVALRALALARNAGAHVIVPPPTLRDLRGSYHFLLALLAGGGAGAVGWFFQWPRPGFARPYSGAGVLLLWWLWFPLALFLYSRFTGNSVFVPRYLSLVLAGTGLAATAIAACFIPEQRWGPMSLALGLGVLIFMGQWTIARPRHDNSDWRGAAQAIKALHLAPSTPVIYPSPFIEARSPVWRPDYPLPGFLYCHLLIYPVGGTPYLFPFESSPEAERYAADLAGRTLSSAGRFLIYGGDRNVLRWQTWFRRRLEFQQWRTRRLGPFGDVEVALFEGPSAVAAR
ncbi:MAG TPA: glycosyltransferase family 39 protein [Bryobacteraceae bacterium]|nr:glycosyltransferase family 39 protein [Bryobacteraceae bacterium]